MMPISMNLSSERKHTMKPLLTVISLALAVVSPAFAGIDWGFDNSANPAGATVGSGTATITVGALGTGWQNGGSLPWNLGTAQGFWDLGGNGSIILSGFSASGPVTLNVFQWVDPGTYSGDLGLTTSSGSSAGTLLQVVQISSSGPTGAWWEYAASLNLAPGATVTIAAGPGGAIIDRLTLVPEPTTYVAGAILLIPLALSTWPLLRRRKTTDH
jgi:hypothetical protein